MTLDNLSENDANSKFIELPDVFDGVAGDGSYSARHDISAFISWLSSGEIDAEVFAMKVFASCDSVTTRRRMPGFALGYDEVLQFAQEVVAALPIKPFEPEPEPVEPYSPPIEPTPKVIPVPPQPWIDQLRRELDTYVKTSCFGWDFQQKAVISSLKSYCAHGLFDITKDSLRKEMDSRYWDQVDKWLAAIEQDRAAYIENEKIRIQKDIEKIQLAYRKAAQSRAEGRQAGKLSAEEFENELNQLGAKVKKMIREKENERAKLH